MTKPELILHIEELLGSEGSKEQAIAVFNELELREYATPSFYNPSNWRLAEVSEAEWLSVLQAADENLTNE